jgi:hypothetical protein
MAVLPFASQHALPDPDRARLLRQFSIDLQRNRALSSGQIPFGIPNVRYNEQ